MSKRAEARKQSLSRTRPAAFAAGLALLLLAGSGTPLAAYPQVPGQAPGHAVMLQRGDLYTVAHGVLPAADLVIDGGKIVAIGKGLPVPAGAEVIDVSGKRVYPGLIAAVTSLGLVEIDAVRATRDQSERWPVTPEVLAATAYNPDSEVIPVTRAGGVTTAQVMPVGGLIRGRSFVVHLDGWTREDAAAKPLDGLVVAWPAPLLEARPSIPGSEDLRKESEEARETLKAAFTDARSYALARKADPSLPVEARWEAMRPLFEGKMPLYVLADDARQIREALAFAKEQGLSLVILGGLEADLVADQLVADGVPVIAGSTQAMPGSGDDAYDQRFTLPARLAKAGVRFALAHTDTAPSNLRNLAFQAGMAAAFGLSKEDALRSITLSAAEILGIADREGSLEVGKDATLFVSEGDVLDMLGQRVTRMYIQGRPVDLDTRQKGLYRKYLERQTRK